jgi:ribosomal protein S18 acetylase RimI-like enzyme
VSAAPRAPGQGPALVFRLAGRETPPPYELLLDADPSRAAVDEALERGELWLALASEEIIGALILLPTRPHVLELVNIAVAPDHQGRGHGKTLVLFAIEQARAAGFRTLEVGTGSASLTQLALYQKCGFRVQGVDPDFFIRNYAEPIFENGIQLRDMLRLSLALQPG